MRDYFLVENKKVKELFVLDDILEFQLHHNVEILRDEDYMYSCYIDGKGYGVSLTPMHALTIGISQFKDNQTNG